MSLPLGLNFSSKDGYIPFLLFYTSICVCIVYVLCMYCVCIIYTPSLGGKGCNAGLDSHNLGIEVERRLQTAA